MAKYEFKDQCGSCEEFFDKRGNCDKPYDKNYYETGYCREHKAFYYPDDSCGKHKERYEPSSSLCYITTIVCNILGFEDINGSAIISYIVIQGSKLADGF